MTFPTFFNLSLNFAIRSSWSEPQSPQLQVLFLLTIQSFSNFGCKEHNQSYFSIDHLVMSICRVVSSVFGKGCLLWPECSLNKTLLAFALLHFVLQGQTCLLFQVYLDFLLLHSNPQWWKWHLSHVCSRKSCNSSWNLSIAASLASEVWAWTWIAVIVNGLPWKQTDIILSF